MTDLTHDEQRFLLAAFKSSPEHWFRPQRIGRQAAVSIEATNRVVASLASGGLLDGLPDCHARLTARGRKLAVAMALPISDVRRRRSLRIALVVLACVVQAGIIAAVAFKAFGLL